LCGGASSAASTWARASTSSAGNIVSALR
jgi:hypothetical protein